MTTILPRQELLRRAIEWISVERIGRPEAPLSQIVGEAATQFDLTPAEERWLHDLLEGQGAAG